MIRRLAYVSRPRPGMSLGEIPRIVAAVRARNDVVGITGVLLFTGQDFAQMIEGPPQVVANLWASIRADPRHHDIVVFHDERAPARWFNDSRVGFPSDEGVIAQVEAWRRSCGALDSAKGAELRNVLAAIDAI